MENNKSNCLTMKKLLFLVAAIIGFARCAQQQPIASQDKSTEPIFEVKVDPNDILSIRYDDDLVREAKAAYNAKVPQFMALFNEYRSTMEDRYMDVEPIHITDDVQKLAPSLDPRDNISLSPYWWPDPDTEDGLPYIRNDGIKNPGRKLYRCGDLCGIMTLGAENLAFLYLITGQEEYAAKATSFLRAFYLDPDKGMNPNLVFVQHVPGMKRIRGTGLLSSGRMTSAVNAAQMMSGSESWTDKDEADMQDWAAAYLYWMEYSTHGQEEHRGENNHAMWYEVNREHLALYSKEYNYLAEILLKYQYPRLSKQVAADSTMPQETARTLGLHYTTYTLNSVAQTSIIARKIGLNDVWTHTGDNGRGMLWALDFIIPYWQAPETWPYMQIRPAVESGITNILYQAYKSTNDQKYEDLAHSFGFSGIASYGSKPSITSLLYYKFKK